MSEVGVDRLLDGAAPGEQRRLEPVQMLRRAANEGAPSRR
jgi:hypothetical protein